MVFVFIISARACSLGSSKNFRKFSESKRIKVTSHVPPPTMLQVVRADEEIQHATVVEDEAPSVILVNLQK